MKITSKQRMAKQIESFIPLDKSWLMRMGLLDLAHGYKDIEIFLSKQEQLSDDLQGLLRTSRQWRAGTVIDVGESGTLLRFLRFLAWSHNEEREITFSGTLKSRPVTNNPAIIHLPLGELPRLDGGTSQWASAAVLLGSDEPEPKEIPYKLRLTYEALHHWRTARQAGQTWHARADTTIKNQALAYLIWRQTGVMKFEPQQAEDYCFARAFNLITAREGEKRWPALRGHESDRIAAMEAVACQAKVHSKDHRVVQAVAMRGKKSADGFTHPSAVNKSWPQFWRFMEYVDAIV